MTSQSLKLMAGDQIKFARQQAKLLLKDTQPDEWFWQPAEGVTHLAWQVGHLAVAEYSLAIERIEGPQASQPSLVSEEMRRLFGRGSVPLAGAENYPPLDEIIHLFDRVHQRVLDLLPIYADRNLNVPVDKPHPMCKTKLEALFFCSQHELMHVGQIALLRRLMGKEPLR